MSYSTQVAELLAGQLARLVTLNRHQLAGQAANLDFWLAEVRHALAVLDGYARRFRQMKAAQTRHVAVHRTTEFQLDDPCCTASAPAPPRRVPDAELREARRAVCEAAYRFLLRCHVEGFLDEPAVRAACADLGLGIDPADLRGGG